MKRAARLSIVSKVLQNVEDGGPTRRETLEHFAERHGAKNGSMVVDGLLGSNDLVVIGWARGARLGTPAQARALAKSPAPKKTKVLQG